MMFLKAIKLRLINIGVPQKILDSINVTKSEQRRALFLRLKYHRCGWGTTIDKYVNIREGKYLTIGEYSVINSFVHIWAGKNSGVVIGNRVLIASHVTITSLTHDYTIDDMRFKKAISKKVTVNDDVWIGSHAVILPGITIGQGAVIGAGAIVTKNVPKYSIVVGNPAKIIKYRF